MKRGTVVSTFGKEKNRSGDCQGLAPGCTRAAPTRNSPTAVRHSLLDAYQVTRRPRTCRGQHLQPSGLALHAAALTSKGALIARQIVTSPTSYSGARSAMR